MTPRLSRHARERCAEMGISTKVAKHIAQAPSLTYPGKPGTSSRVVVSTRHPEYAIVLAEGEESSIVVTVLFRTVLDYVRQGPTFRAVS